MLSEPAWVDREPQPSDLGAGKGTDARSWGSLGPGNLGFWASNQESNNPGFTRAPPNHPGSSRILGPSGLLATPVPHHLCWPQGHGHGWGPLPPFSLDSPGLQLCPRWTGQPGKYLRSPPSPTLFSGQSPERPWGSSHSGLAWHPRQCRHPSSSELQALTLWGGPACPSLSCREDRQSGLLLMPLGNPPRGPRSLTPDLPPLQNSRWGSEAASEIGQQAGTKDAAVLPNLSPSFPSCGQTAEL